MHPPRVSWLGFACFLLITTTEAFLPPTGILHRAVRNKMLDDPSILDFIADPSRELPAVPQNVYVPSTEMDNFPQIVAGSLAGVFVYAWAAYEFGKRIVTQRRCEICNGSGLVTISRTGATLSRPRKCYACGGFLPWVSWSNFWVANKDIGNGGILRRPAADYEELNKKAREAKDAETVVKPSQVDEA